MQGKQKDCHSLCADDVYCGTYAWLKQRKYEKLITRQLINKSAMTVARRIQLSGETSCYGGAITLLRMIKTA